MESTCESEPSLWGRLKTMLALLERLGVQRVGEDEESGEVVFVGLDAFFEYFHSVEWCCCF